MSHIHGSHSYSVEPSGSSASLNKAKSFNKFSHVSKGFQGFALGIQPRALTQGFDLDISKFVLKIIPDFDQL